MTGEGSRVDGKARSAGRGRLGTARVRGVAAGVMLSAVLAGGGTDAAAAPQQDAAAAAPQTAEAVVARALDLMGGDAVVGLERVRFDMMTQWQRTNYRDVPGTDRPSFEPHVDVRDYTIPAWRNTRDFGVRSLVNVVRDTVATTDFGDGPRPQSVAYVDERDELFAYTPDRLVLRLSRADDLRTAGDTTLGGELHRRVRATIEPGMPVTVAFHAGSGLPTLLEFTRGHPNDFGLVPFGDMEVAVWYSAWRTFGALSLPTQWDIERAGAPYKRMTVRNAAFDPAFDADSFAVSDDVRAAFLAERRPMHDRPVDSVTVVARGLVAVHSFGFPAGAVRLGEDWLLLEAGHAPLSLTRALEALAPQGAGRPTAALVAAARPGNGGVATLIDEGVPVYTSRAARPFVDAVLRGAGGRGATASGSGVTVVDRPRSVGAGPDALQLEPIDLPDTPGSLVAYAPSLRWLYAPDAVTALDVRLVRERAAARGWIVERLGTARGLAVPH